MGIVKSPSHWQSVEGVFTSTSGVADDIGRLAAREFYFKTEQSGTQIKLRTPIYVSRHPVTHRFRKKSSYGQGDLLHHCDDARAVGEGAHALPGFPT